mmetsp:Transcript_22911/g.26117  ORF Transcript_22911/g.26117 Transcript_22911/m.26117 type:complete len:430 (-) Transcript_22911:146-1435(-)
MGDEENILTNVESGNCEIENDNSNHTTLREGGKTANIQIEEKESKLLWDEVTHSSIANRNENDFDKDAKILNSRVESEDNIDGGDEEDLEPEAREEDVDFDNFGQITVEETVDEEKIASRDSDASKHDNDFGNFGDFSAIPTKQIVLIKEKNILYSSDNSTVRDSKEFAHSKMSSQENIRKLMDVANNDKIVDFEDFDTASITMQADVLLTEEAEDEFGDFADFIESSEVNKVVETVPQEDSFIKKARLVFENVFASDKLENEQIPMESEELNSPMKLNLVLDEINSSSENFEKNGGLVEEKFMAADWAMNSLATMLLPSNMPIIKESSNILIFDRKICHHQSRYASLIFAETPKLLEMTQSAEHRQRVYQKDLNSPENIELSDLSNSRRNNEDDKNDSQVTVVTSLNTDVKLDFSDFKVPKRRFWTRS